jgi:hypothetical protein
MNEENATSKHPLIRFVNRRQMSWRAVDVERLIGEDRAARAIWPMAVTPRETTSRRRPTERSIFWEA